MRSKIVYRIVPIILFILVLTLYSLTFANINTGYADSDEFLIAAKVLGVAHPPAYPLYTMLAALFGRLPIPYLNFAGRVNFLSVILHASTVVLFYFCSFLLLQKMLKNQRLISIISILGSLSLAFMFSFWFYGLFAEVFPLNNFFVALTLLLLIIWEKEYRKNKKKSEKFLIIAAASYGLGLSNQQAILFMAPTYALWVFFTNMKIVFNWKLILKAFAIFIASALLPYVYVIIAASRHPVLNWENAHDWYSLYRIITRRIYAEANSHGLAYSATLDKKLSIEGIERFFRYIWLNFTPFLTILGLLGIVFLIIKKQYKILATIIAGIFGGGLLYSILAPLNIHPTDSYYHMTLGTYERFYLSSPILFSFLIAFGIVCIFKLAEEVIKEKAVVVLIIVILGISFIAANNFKEIKQNNFYLGYEFGKTMLESLQKNAILLCFSEHSCFTGVYLQQAENIRRDVLIVPADFIETSPAEIRSEHPNLIKTSTDRLSSQRSILLTRDLIRWQIDRRPIYEAGIMTSEDFIAGYSLNRNPFYLVPVGCAMKISKTFYIAKDNPCKKVEDDYLHTHVTDKAAISYMFPEYFMYQRYLNGYLYALHACGNAAFAELERAQKLAPQAKDIGTTLKSIKGMPKTNLCLGQIAEVKFDDVLKKALEANKKKDLQTALYYMTQAVALGPRDIKARFTLANMYLQATAFYNAAIEYDDILALDPNNEYAKTQYLKVKRAIELRLSSID